MLSRTKLFLIGYFLPSWIASLLMWGDDRTSSSFEAAPPWFYYGKFFVQILAILILFMPVKLRTRPSLTGFAIASTLIISIFFANALLEAEFVLLNSSLQIATLAIYLCFSQPSAKIEPSDIRFFFYMLMGGFLIQVVLFMVFGRMPSHSITDVFVRFNGITNDSLSAGLILPLLVPWAVRTSYPMAKTGAVILASVLTGSLFGAMMVPTATIVYAISCRLYKFAAIMIAGMLACALYFYTLFAAIIDLKFLSILTHLRFFLDLSGVQYQQPATSCAEEFCESFLESGLSLSPVYMSLLYILLLCFIIPLIRSNKSKHDDALIRDTLRVYALTVIVGSLVHPVPLIPFVIPLFLVLTSLYVGTSKTISPKAGMGTATLLMT